MAFRRLSNRVDVQRIVFQYVGDAKLGDNRDCLRETWKPPISLIRSITGFWLFIIQYLLGDEAKFPKPLAGTSHHQDSEGSLQASLWPLLARNGPQAMSAIWSLKGKSGRRADSPIW